MEIIECTQTDLVIGDCELKNPWSLLMSAVIGRTFRFNKVQNILTISYHLFSKIQIPLSNISALQLTVDNDFEVSTYGMVWLSLLVNSAEAVTISENWYSLVDIGKIMQAIAEFLDLRVLEAKTMDLIIANLELEVSQYPDDLETRQELEQFLDKRKANTMDLIIAYLELKVAEDPDDLTLHQNLAELRNRKVDSN
jgi:hypothetical protein